MLNAALCICLEKRFEPDNLCELRGLRGPIDEEKVSALLWALAAGKVSSWGYLTNVRLNAPEFGEDACESLLKSVRNDWRSNEAFVLAFRQEPTMKRVCASLWRDEFTIWEQSSLWLSHDETELDALWRRMRPYPAEKCDVGRPYELLEVMAFTEIKLSVRQLNEYFRSEPLGSSQSEGAELHSARQTRGRRAQEDWPGITEILVSKIDQDDALNWESWADLWGYLETLLKQNLGRGPLKSSHKAFMEWLKANDIKALSRIRGRIKSSPLYAPCRPEP